MISLIAAIGTKGELGLNNKMLWHIKEDFKHFKETTMGHTLLMGRKTFESIGKPLPGRKTLILTRNSTYQVENCVTVHSLKEGLDIAVNSGEDEFFIAGGGEIYKQALPLVDRMYLSFVDYEGEADAFFPEVSWNEWKLLSEKKFAMTERSPAWTLKTFERINL